ncbi:hypothetical protein B0H13DRAFT_2444144 [Mycena leptocephala]|nr:hypothetical protein B0H13DRAFT_2444144 [Mycena leptocephala]
MAPEVGGPNTWTTQPYLAGPSTHQPSVVFLPGLLWERSPYACVPLPDVSAAHADPAIPSGRDSAGRYEVTQPPCPRLQPIALPPQITGVTTVTLNPVLRFGAKSAGGARSDVDFALYKPWTRLDADVLAQPAIFPGLPSMTLLSPLLPWAITAHTSSGCVVVEDVLQAIRRELAIPITEDELDEWLRRQGDDSTKQGDSWRKGPTETMTGDALRARSLTQKRGKTRLDFLDGRTRFGGLSEGTMGCDIWVVNLV